MTQHLTDDQIESRRRHAEQTIQHALDYAAESANKIGLSSVIADCVVDTGDDGEPIAQVELRFTVPIQRAGTAAGQVQDVVNVFADEMFRGLP